MLTHAIDLLPGPRPSTRSVNHPKLRGDDLMKILLDDADLDAQLGRTLIASSADAADLGEALATASRTRAGDYDSWFDEWSATAQVAQALGDDALAKGRDVTARKAYLRASEYWRQSFFFIRHDIGDERLQHAWRQHRMAFRAAQPLLGWPTVTAELPFEGASMTAYLFRPNDDGMPRPTVLAPCGFDSTAEAGYLSTGYMALPRGYNFFVFEGPGRAACCMSTAAPSGPTSRFRSRVAFDWLLHSPASTRRPSRSSGRSFGGYLGPRAAAFEPRVAALVADPGQFEFASRIGGFAKGELQPSRRLRGSADGGRPRARRQLEEVLDGTRNREWYGARMAAMGVRPSATSSASNWTSAWRAWPPTSVPDAGDRGRRRLRLAEPGAVRRSSPAEAAQEVHRGRGRRWTLRGTRRHRVRELRLRLARRRHGQIRLIVTPRRRNDHRSVRLSTLSHTSMSEPRISSATPRPPRWLSPGSV